MIDDLRLGAETAIHGSRWQSVHNGYFADPAVALPFLDAISREILNTRPGAIADLGGGTGFILSELAKRHPDAGIKYVNVDISSKQLRECLNPHITALHSSAFDVTRDALIHDDRPLMLIIRSVLHYLGVEGALPFLSHLRAQMKPGETMVQQTVCFDTSEGADCANELYCMMRTPKWYPTVSGLGETLISTGWLLADCARAYTLSLKSPELAERYNLSNEDLASISRRIGMKYHCPDVFTTHDSPDATHFTAFLHYRIFTCRAV